MDALTSLDLNYRGRFTITSGFRCPHHNAAVHGSPHSRHLSGNAVDLAPVNVTLKELARAVLSTPAFSRGGFGYYPNRGIIHADVRPTPAAWCMVHDHYAPLDKAWNARYPMIPLPKVPATRLPYQPAP
jgi:uncharacterized protein YcbK (DUF882 family)